MTGEGAPDGASHGEGGGGGPWILGDLVFARSTLANVEAHAVECYPDECCGLMTGPASEARLVDEVRREVNEADKYHALDPVTFPRTARTYFKLNELRASRAFDAGRAAGRPVKVIYHSHCDAGAYFSAEDAATFAAGGTLMWPCAFLVVSVKGGAVVDRKLWVHVPGTDGFTESRLEVREG